jgi:uncharacterized protein (TIGR02302 family)
MIDRAFRRTASPKDGAPAPAGRIERLVSRAGLALWWERLWPPLAGVAGVVALFAALSWIGTWTYVPAWLRVVLLVGLGAMLLVPLIALARVRPPRRDEAVRRIETISGTTHRPLTAVEDGLASAGDDPATAALWRAHRTRMETALGGLRAGTPRPALFRRDPWAMRALVGALVFVGIFAGAGDYLGRMGAAFAPLSVPAAEPPMRLDAWVSPPPYTGRAPVFLTGEGRVASDAPLRMPAGSEVVVRLHGAADAVVLADGPDGPMPVDIAAPAETADTARPAATTTPTTPAAAGPMAVREYRVPLDADGAVAVTRGDTELARWAFAVEPDRPPTVVWVGEPKPAVSGALELAYEIGDDYGVIDGRAEFVPKDAATAGVRPLVDAPEAALALPSHRARAGSTKTMQDFTSHPWAGAKVDVTLVVRDEAGQEGRSETIMVTLPERAFRKPLARAVVEQRRTLALDARAQTRVIDALDALMIAPAGLFDSASSYIGMRLAYGHLVRAESDEQLTVVLDELWSLALAIEDGDLSLAARELRDAQEALRKALENGASEEEIARLTQELREAMENFLASLAEQMRQNPQAAQPMDPNAQTLRPQDLDRMLDRIEELARQGSTEAAQQLLSQLQQMLENLQAARPMQPGEGQQGEGPLDELGRMIQEQQRLMDETYGLERGQQPGQQRPMTPEEMAEAMRRLQEGQGQLAEQLQRLLDQMGQGQQPGEGQQGEGQQGQQGQQGEGQGPGQGQGQAQGRGQGQGQGENGSLGQAGEAMGRARDALGQGEAGGAIGPQGDALDALRRGAQQMAEQMMGEGQPGPGAGGQTPSALNEDPLGRMRRTEGPDLGTSVRVPDEIDVQRARRILDELRRRLGDPTRPQLELDYLDRLLPRN